MGVIVSGIQVRSCIEVPVMLNGWKHHLVFLKNQVRNWSAKPAELFPLFVAKLKVLDGSPFDMYTGKLSPDAIAHDIANTLMGFNAYDKEAYFRWIDSSTQLFWQVEISDGSEWILRKNESSPYYIEICPGPHSRFSHRLQPDQLRTALATLIMSSIRAEKPGLKLMNNVRRDYLGQSMISKVASRDIYANMHFIAKEAGVTILE